MLDSDGKFARRMCRGNRDGRINSSRSNAKHIYEWDKCCRECLWVWIMQPRSGFVSMKAIKIRLLCFSAILVAAGFVDTASILAAGISYTYDSLNRLIKADYDNGLVISYTYDAAGNRVTYSGTASNDTNAPGISISGSSFTTNNPVIDLNGTATDNIGVTLVTWSSDQGGIGIASGTNLWNINGIHVQSGANVITVTAYDAAGNRSEERRVGKECRSRSPP